MRPAGASTRGSDGRDVALFSRPGSYYLAVAAFNSVISMPTKTPGTPNVRVASFFRVGRCLYTPPERDVAEYERVANCAA